MKLSDSIKRLGFTISKQNKPNSTDADALNSIIEFINLSNKQVVKDNELLAKIYCFVLNEKLLKYKDIDLVSKMLNQNILSKPLIYHLQLLKLSLEQNELNLYFESLNLNPTWEVGMNLKKIEENINLNKDIFKNVNIQEFKEVSETWDMDNVIANFEFNFNLALNTYKNV